MNSDVSIYGDAKIFGNAEIGGHATVFEHAWISGNAVISGVVCIGSSARVYEHAYIDGDVSIADNVDVAGDTVINCMDDFIVMHNNWTSGRAFIWTRSNNKWRVGCFYGTGEELIERHTEIPNTRENVMKQLFVMLSNCRSTEKRIKRSKNRYYAV